MTETKKFLYIEALNDHDGSGTDPDYYKNDFCRFTFIGRDVFSGKEYTIPNCKYIYYNETTGEYQFNSSFGYINIKRKYSGVIELTTQGTLILTIDNILLTEENDTRHIIRHHQMTAGKRKRRKRRTKKRTKKRRYL
jgi:hypothetical protein